MIGRSGIVLPRLVVVLALALGVVLGGFARQVGAKTPAAQTAADVTIQVLSQQQSPASATSSSLVNPTASVVTTLTFAAASWQGGWLRNNSGFLGRPWVAIYGAQSNYPRASLVFSLDDVPTGDVRVVLTGICDE